MTGPAEAFRVPGSYAQQRMWFLDQLEPGNAAYAMSVAVRMRGPLSVEALRAALTATVRRHEALRTTFVDPHGDGSCLQLVASDAVADLDVHDVSGQADPVGALDDVLARTDRRGFDLERGPLFTATLVRTADDDHALVLRLHHIVGDAWSIGVLARDLAAFYRAEVEHTSSGLPELSVQYADYSMWQRDRLAGAALDDELDHWRRELDGAPPLLELPLDRARPQAPRHVAGTVTRRWDAPLADGLRSLAADTDATLFMVLLAGYAAVLARFGGGEDIVIGTPVAGRGRPEFDDVIGLFVNTLALRLPVDRRDAFSALVERARTVSLRALSHQDLPFEQLVGQLRPERSLTYNPIVQTLLVLQNASGPGTPWPGLEVTPLEHGRESATAKLDLSLFVHEVGRELELVAEFDADILDAQTVANILDDLRGLLRTAVAQPDAPLASLGSDARVSYGHHPGRPDEEPTATVVDLFRARAARAPHDIALEHAGAGVTVAELDRASLALARTLRTALAGGPGRTEPLIAICLPRGPELIVALLAVLRVGAGYLPLDPAYPPDRLAAMIEDSGAALVLTCDDVADVLPDPGPPRLSVGPGVTGVADVAVAGSSGDPVGRLDAVTAAEVAYVLYTSGSTGRPKGVQITHANAVSMLRWAAAAFAPADRARVLASTSICFDLSIFEIFLPLCFGGTVVLVDDVLDAAARRVPATLVNTVPSALTELLRTDGLPPGATTVCLAGEALPGRLVADAYAQDGVRAVHNLYGPTESTTYSTTASVPAGDPRPPSIGRPVTGTSALLLDRSLRPVPDGAPGEIHLAGPGVARGYLRRPGLTADRFVPDPYGTTPGARMYRTGDLARARTDGELHYLGRRDHQVKLRGFRIELGEIESTLRDHPDVRDAVVVLDDGGVAGPRLVAHVAASTATPDELLARCRRSLPAFMVPAVVLVQPDLLRTPNGKIDRAALPSAAGHDRPRTQRYVAPADALQRLLAGLWAGLLGADRVGTTDDFFALGGHSLLATRLVAEVRSTLGAALPLRAVFEEPTVAGLARRLLDDEPRPGELLAIAEVREQVEQMSAEDVLARLDES